MEVPVEIVVTSVEVDLQAATVALGLSCGHRFPPFTIASHPIVSLLGIVRVHGSIPYVGDRQPCPTCGTHIRYGVISDDPVH